ncbi:hypothetical protein FHR83_005681 [Actinoplanes campanulatus]|uniref:Uncharacterized protein n=1 Tax=Actinoplanes campanulatus TaxID=113559 RepID=A0A7W5AKJ8_9ACTN|nr:hypothetical protein [Actinoplanes campanulatus]MBB3097996.1 hypothetical protein [Actinoplanes campanulatus]GGN31810.1 hypothetical protein GCM10010109_52330 [Actinoplanes campanulatus]GID41383.1 hypothetical protein Aca09nite_78890 [Actinoplanes campanulatus]
MRSVATTVGAPMPQKVMLGYDLNAFTTAVGVRRTRVLCIGLPLWATLEPQEWVLERHPRQTATVRLTASDAARIDEELAVHQKRVQRELTYG